MTNNRGLARLDDELGAVRDVRVRLCLREEPTVCGQTVLAEHGERRETGGGGWWVSWLWVR